MTGEQLSGDRVFAGPMIPQQAGYEKARLGIARRWSITVPSAETGRCSRRS